MPRFDFTAVYHCVFSYTARQRRTASTPPPPLLSTLLLCPAPSLTLALTAFLFIALPLLCLRSIQAFFYGHFFCTQRTHRAEVL